MSGNSMRAIGASGREARDRREQAEARDRREQAEARDRREQAEARDRREKPWRGAKPKVKTVLIGKAKTTKLEVLGGLPLVGTEQAKNQVRKEFQRPVALLPRPGSSFDENMLGLAPPTKLVSFRLG